MNRIVSIITWILLGWIFPTFLVKKIEGKENFSKKRNYILVSNHVSHLDWLIGCYVCTPRKYAFIGQVDKMTGIIGFCRDLMYTIGGVIRVDRNDEESKERAISKAIEMLKNGYNLFMYPEGTRSRDGKLQRFRRGVGRIYLETGVPVLPLAMVGAYELMPSGGGIKLRRSVEVKFSKPLEFPNELKTAAGLDKNSDTYSGLCEVIAQKAEDEVRKLMSNVKS